MGHAVVCDQLQKLVLLSVGKIDDLLLLLDFLRQRAVSRQLVVHPHILCDHGVGVGFGVAEHFVEYRLDLFFIDRKRGAGVRAVFDLAGAEPFAVLPAASVFGFPPVVGLAAMRTPELSGQEVCVVADALTVLYILTAALEDFVCFVP